MSYRYGTATNHYPMSTPASAMPSKWRSTNAVFYVSCPSCGAEATYCCETPTGRRSSHPHRTREAALMSTHPAIAQQSVFYMTATVTRPTSH